MTLPLLGVGPGGGAPVPSFIGNSKSGFNFVPSHNIVLPSIINAGDTILLAIFNGTGAAISTPPSGYTLHFSETTQQPFVYIYRKTAVGNEGGTTVTFGFSNSNTCNAAFVLKLVDNIIETPVFTRLPTSGTGFSTPPAISGLTLDDYIMLEFTTFNRNDNSPDGPSTGYNNFLGQESSTTNSTSANAISLGAAWKYAMQVTSETPGNMIWNGNLSSWRTGMIIACR